MTDEKQENASNTPEITVSSEVPILGANILKNSDGLRSFARPSPEEDLTLFWGTSASGKTTLIEALFGAALENHSAWQLEPDGLQSNVWIRSNYARFHRGEFSQATKLNEENLIKFQISRRDGSKKPFTLVFLDMAGELFENPFSAPLRANIESPLEFLRLCKRVIILIDPTKAVKKEPHPELETMLNALLSIAQDKAGKPLPVKDRAKVAYCVTKCDEPNCRVAFNDVEAFVAQHFGHKILGIIKILSPNHRWFAVSALGFEEGKPSNVFTRYDGGRGIAFPNKYAPRGIMDALDWLFDN